MKNLTCLFIFLFFFTACGPTSKSEEKIVIQDPVEKNPESPYAGTLSVLDQNGVHFQIIDGQYEWEAVKPMLTMLGNMFMFSMEQASPEGIDPNVMETLSALPEKFGVDEMVARGSSTKELDQGGYHSKYVLQSTPDASGWMWNFAGEEMDIGKRIRQFPESTAVFAHYSVNGPLILSEIQTELQPFPEADAGLKEGLRILKEENIPLDPILNSLKSGVSLGITLNESVSWILPVPGLALSIPETGIVIMFDDPEGTLKDYLVGLLKANPMFPVQESADSGVPANFIALPVPVSTAVSLQIAQINGTTVICTSSELMKQLVQRHEGNAESTLASNLERLTSTRASNAIVVNPETGGYFKESYEQVLRKIELEAGEDAMVIRPMVEFYGSLFGSMPHVTLSRKQGELYVSEMLHRHPLSPQYSNNSVLMVPAVGGMLAAIAVPSFHKAREEAQRAACINNLRLIEAGKDQHAIITDLATGAEVTEEQVGEYIKNGFPVCPADGNYSLNPVDTSPTCSVHGGLDFY